MDLNTRAKYINGISISFASRPVTRWEKRYQCSVMEQLCQREYITGWLLKNGQSKISYSSILHQVHLSLLYLLQVTRGRCFLEGKNTSGQICRVIPFALLEVFGDTECLKPMWFLLRWECLRNSPGNKAVTLAITRGLSLQLPKIKYL